MVLTVSVNANDKEDVQRGVDVLVAELDRLDEVEVTRQVLVELLEKCSDEILNDVYRKFGQFETLVYNDKSCINLVNNIKDEHIKEAYNYVKGQLEHGQKGLVND